MFALSSSLSAHVAAVLWLNPSSKPFFFSVLMFLEKKNCFEFLNIDVTLLNMPLYFLQSSVDPDEFALRNKVFPLLHWEIHASTLGMQVSMVV